MIRLTLPGTVFRNVALLSTGAVLTTAYHRGTSRRIDHLLWIPGHESDAPRTIAEAFPANFLFQMNCERYLRACGLWREGGELPDPIPTNEPIQPPLVPVRGWYPMGFHPNGETAIFQQYNAHVGHVYHIRRADGSLAQIPTPSRGMYSHAVFNLNGTRLAMSFGDSLDVWETAAPRYLGRFTAKSAAVYINTPPAFLDETRLVMAAGRSVCVWNTDARKVKTPRKLPAFRKFVDALAVSPDDRRMLAGDRSGEVRLYDGRTLDEIGRYDWKVGAVAALAFAPDGLTAAVAGADGVVVWDVE